MPGILHGDFHQTNVMFRHDGPELAAVIDWELATIGDPLLDLGWMLAAWPRADGSHLKAPMRVLVPDRRRSKPGNACTAQRSRSSSAQPSGSSGDDVRRHDPTRVKKVGCVQGGGAVRGMAVNSIGLRDLYLT